MAIFSSKLSGKILPAWCRQLGNALNAGLPILSILESEAMRPTIRRISRPVWDEILTVMQNGSSFADALRRREEHFPPLFIAMVEVGEKSGNLGDILLELAGFYDRLLQLRKTFILSLMWPAFQLTVAIGVLGLVILVQGLLDFDMLGIGLSGVDGLLKYVTFLSITGIIGIALFLWMRNNMTRVRWMTYLINRIPVIGGIFRSLAVSRLTRAMNLTMKTGMDVYDALELSFKAAAYPPVSDCYAQIKTILSGGGTLFEGFRKAGVFNDLILMELHTAEETGTVPESMHRIATQYFDETMQRIKTATGAASILFYLFVACMIIFFIFRMAGFYFGMIRDIGNF